MTTSLSPDKMSRPSSVHNRHRVNAFPSSKRYVIILYGKIIVLFLSELY